MSRPKPDETEPRERPAHQPAGKSLWAWLLLLGLASFLLALDLGSTELAFERVAGAPVTIDKAAVLANDYAIPAHEGIGVIPYLLDLKLVVNRGAVFGVGHGGRWFFAGFTVVALTAAVLMFAGWTDRRDWPVHVGVASVLAGGLGNLYDRLAFACVRDFLHLFPETRLFPWIFNLADAVLLFGIGLLMLHFWRKDRQAARQAREKA
ncbi:MAG: signal peptidase II [Phycisphaerales bacterium JB038]